MRSSIPSINLQSAIRDPQSLIRPLIRSLHAYIPGEQPKIKGLIKLNTNENPYPPSPNVLKAVKAAVDGRLRLYPDPTAQALRKRLAKLHGCGSENIIVGNGSDELLALVTRAFTEPTKKEGARGKNATVSRGTIQYFTPSYSLYPVLADIHGAVKNPLPLNPDFSLPSLKELKNAKQWDFHAGLSYVTTPNAPSGRSYSTTELDALCCKQRGVVILDEAYVDFAEENALNLALEHSHVLVARTFSKAYSLCFQRIGYMVGHPELIAALDKIRDSYNVNGLGQLAALATLDDLPYYRTNFQRIITTRERLRQQLTRLGFEVFPSQTNFMLCRPPKLSAERWLAELRARNVLVRWFSVPEVRDCLRISIGTDRETEALVRATVGVLRDLVSD